MWQDYALTICAVLFGYSLLPQLYKNWKTKSVSQISWHFLLAQLFAILIASITTWTLDLTVTSIINFVQFACMVIMTIQKRYYGVAHV